MFAQKGNRGKETEMSKYGKRCVGKSAKASMGENRARKLFLVDIENLCGKAALTVQDAVAARNFVDGALGLSGSDLVVVGASHSSNLISAGAGWMGPRWVFGRGHDGADKALVKAAGEYAVETFEEVVIISGDGIFTDVADSISSQGVIVSVVALKGHLSHRLAKAASSIRLVDDLELAA